MLQKKKIFQADGREIKLLGLIDLHVEVSGGSRCAANLCDIHSE